MWRVRSRTKLDQLGLLVVATYWTVIVRVGLTVGSMKWLRRTFLPLEMPGDFDEAKARAVIKSVQRAAKLVPFASCLTQAMSAQIMLARRDCRSVLYLGTRRSEDGAFHAHAWLEGGDKLLLGGTRASLATFVPLAQYRSVK